MSESVTPNPLGYKPIPQLLAANAVPAVIANMVSALYNIVDQIFIGRGVGYLGNAATNIAFPLTTICLALGLMTGIGAAANFNIELGRKNPDRAKYVAGSALGTLVILGVILSLLVVVCLKPLLLFFGATDQILAYAMTYTSITALGLPFLLLSIATNPLVRADGSATYSMMAIIVGALLNIVLDGLFMFVFHWGIAGAAWATVISQMISAMVLLGYFKRFKSVRFTYKDFIPRLDALKVTAVLGMTSFVFQFSNMIIQVTANNLLNVYGASSVYGSDIAIAAAGIVTKVNIIFIAIIIGIVQGSQPICGFNYGAKKYGRVRQTLGLVLKVSFLISLLAFGIFQLFPKEIISLFGQGNPTYLTFATHYMRVFLSLVFLNGIQISIATFFPGIGRAKKGTVLAVTKQVGILLPLMIFLPRFFGIDGIIYAFPLTDLLAFILGVIFLKDEFQKMPKVDLSEA
ncbi:MATE family efflux transporter [Streptococcus fryi]